MNRTFVNKPAYPKNVCNALSAIVCLKGIAQYGGILNWAAKYMIVAIVLCSRSEVPNYHRGQNYYIT